MSAKELSSKRAACLGAVTRHVNSVRGCLLGQVGELKDMCDEYVKKLLVAKTKFDEIHNRVLEEEELDSKTRDTYEKSASKASRSVISTLDDYDDWLRHGPAITLPEGATVVDNVKQNMDDVHSCTLDMLSKLNQAISGLTSDSVNLAVKSALEDQRIQHRRETEILQSRIEDLTLRLERVTVSSQPAPAVVFSQQTGASESFRDVDYRTSGVSDQTSWRLSDVYSSTRLSGGGDSRPILGRGRARGKRFESREDWTAEPIVGRESGASDLAFSFASVADMMKDFMSQSMAQNSSIMSTLQAPKVKLSQFEGDPLEFASFQTTFDELVHTSYDNDRSRLLLLMEHCKGKARKAIAGCVHMESSAGYREAKAILHRKFGSPHVVTQAWLDRLLSYQRVQDAESLEAFAADIEGCRNSLRTLGSISELNNVGTLQQIISKLPIHLRNRWRKEMRYKRSESCCMIDMLVQLIRDAAEDESDPAFCESVITKVRATYQTAGGTPKTSRSAAPTKKIGVFQTDVQSEEDNDEIEAELHAMNRNSCAACRSGLHFTSRCKKYRDMNPKEKLTFVRDKRLCLLCLADTHSAASCPLPWKCQEKTCGRRHHTSLHSAFDAVREGPKQQVNVIACPGSDEEDGGVEAESYAVISAGNLPLARVTLKYGGRAVSTYALLDPGATVMLCKKSIVDRLRPKTYGCQKMTLLTVSGKTRLRSRLTHLHISEFSSRVEHPLFNAMIVDDIQVSMQGLTPLEEIQSFDHLKDLKFHRGGEEEGVGLLIGQNNAHILDPLETVKGGLLDPYAVGTPVGWLLYGTTQEDFARGDTLLPPPTGAPQVWPPRSAHSLDLIDIEEEDDCSVLGAVNSIGAMIGEFCDEDGGPEIGIPDEACIYAGCECDDACLAESVRRMADLEVVPERKTSFTAEEQYVLDLWEREAKVVDGHIELPIPFISEPPDLINNFAAAYRALMHLGKYLLANEKERLQYRDAVYADFENDHAEIVEDENPALTEFVWYLLHHGVSHLRKPDVTRVVKNGAAAYKGYCINKAAYKGPDLMNNLVDVLSGFRKFKVGTTSDIKGMFNQVYVPPRQRDYSRFLFWEDGDPRKKVIVCRMKTHTFGTIWAPAAANFALKKTGELFATELPEVKESVDKCFYVDDWLDSQVSSDSSVKMLQDVRATVAKGGFDMRKIASNSHDVINSFPASLRVQELARMDIVKDKLPRGVMLGQVWDPESDDFLFTAQLEPRPFTRRGMTSCIASVFDPLGLIAPFILPAKLLLQTSCKTGAGWDDELREATAKHWTEWIDELPEIENFRLRRWFGCTRESVQYGHIFSDASERAYGAAGYLVTKRGEGSDATDASLVTAKSKVTPPNKLTIPKMEMAGAVLGVRVLQIMRRMFGDFITAYFLWVDSTIVLVLIRKDPECLKTFMGNRVAFIQQHTEVDQWGHVPGRLNPADLASRGERITVLNKSELWKNGPQFLKKDPSSWDKRRLEVLEPVDVSGEIKKEKPLFCGMVYSADGGNVTATSEECKQMRTELRSKGEFRQPDEIEKRVIEKIMLGFSDWERTARYAVIMWRFADWWRKGVNGQQRETRFRELDVDEVTREEKNLVCWAQSVHIPADITKESTWKSLLPFRDDAWRVGGWFQFSELSTDVRHPMILPRESPITDLLIRAAHRAGGHGGPERTLLELRGKYWVLGGKTTVKRVIDTCVLCRRLKGRPVQQQMAPLPKERGQPGRPAFWHSGVDLFGPVSVVIKRSTVKRYGAIFTCFNSRAVHLEPVEDLTSSAFLDTLERFTSRHCKPATLKSDNGTNFVGSAKEIERAQQMFSDPQLTRVMVARRISWSFNSPSGSHQGGVWERLIRSVRQILTALLNSHPLTDSRFHTLLTMTEAIMNGRPLTRLTDDVRDLEPLTPGHFVYGGRLSPVLPGEYSADRLRQDWKLSQGIAGEMWERWMALYIPTLQRRSKWLEQRDNVRPNELVLIVSDQYPRYEWPLGVITAVHPGKDGLVRNVTLRTANGTLTRPVQKIVRLELDVP